MIDGLNQTSFLSSPSLVRCTYGSLWCIWLGAGPCMPTHSNLHDAYGTTTLSKHYYIMAQPRPIYPPSYRSNVRILHGSCFPLQSAPPPPPQTPPPKPAHICKLAVVGDALSGKSSVVQKFINRTPYFTQSHPSYLLQNHPFYVGSTDNPKNKNDNIGSNDNNGEGDASCCTEGASSTTTSIGTSIGTSVAAIEPTLAEYHKKDVTIFWNRNKNYSARGKKTSSNRASEIVHSSAEGKNIHANEALNNSRSKEKEECVCVRVQVWDMNIQNYLNLDNDRFGSAAASNFSSCSSQHNSFTFQSRQSSNNMIAVLLPLFKRVNGILIVCKFPDPPCSEHSYPTEWENIAWPEMNELERYIRKWTTFIRGNIAFPSQCNNMPILVSVLLNQPNNLIIENATKLSSRHNTSDTLVYSLKEWRHLEHRMQTICEENGIESWSIGTCLNGSTTKCTPIRAQQQINIAGDSRRHIFRDSEETFIDMISLYLDRLTTSHQ